MSNMRLYATLLGVVVGVLPGLATAMALPAARPVLAAATPNVIIDRSAASSGAAGAAQIHKVEYPCSSGFPVYAQGPIPSGFGQGSGGGNGTGRAFCAGRDDVRSYEPRRAYYGHGRRYRPAGGYARDDRRTR